MAPADRTRLGWAFDHPRFTTVAFRNSPRRHHPSGVTRPRGHLADYERFKEAYEKLLREEPDNLVGITLLQMDLDRSRRVLLGLPVPVRAPYDFEGL